eukprot:9088211-Ditylum_brightwellii.AAC.1
MQQYYLHAVEALAQYAMCMSPSVLQGCVELDRGQTLRAYNPNEKANSIFLWDVDRLTHYSRDVVNHCS